LQTYFRGIPWGLGQEASMLIYFKGEEFISENKGENVKLLLEGSNEPVSP